MGENREACTDHRPGHEPARADAARRDRRKPAGERAIRVAERRAHLEANEPDDRSARVAEPNRLYLVDPSGWVMSSADGGGSLERKGRSAASRRLCSQSERTSSTRRCTTARSSTPPTAASSGPCVRHPGHARTQPGHHTGSGRDLRRSRRRAGRGDAWLAACSFPAMGRDASTRAAPRRGRRALAIGGWWARPCSSSTGRRSGSRSGRAGRRRPTR